MVVIVSLSMNSCFKGVEETPWEVADHPPMLVVDATITNERKQHEVRLTLSNAYFSPSVPPAVSGAAVSVNDGDSIFTYPESMTEPGMYVSESSFAGVPGKTYHLMITLDAPVNGMKEYHSLSVMPEGVNIDSIYSEIYEYPKGLSEENDATPDTTVLVVFYFGREPETAGNYYFAKIYSNHRPLFYTIKDFPLSDDKYRNGQYVNLMTMIKNVSANDTVLFELFSTAKEYNQFLDAASKIDMSGDINSPTGPPANAVGNVAGALGFFLVTYTSSGSSLAIDKRDL